jgi:hypothetical protein
MLPIEIKIERAQRLVRMLEQDVPRLAIRVSELTPEHQQSATSHAAMITACARAELQRLLDESMPNKRRKGANASN